MVKELMHDPFFLSMPSQPAGEKDLPIARDLLDTLIAHRQSCVGMAANMIGQRKRIIAFGINDYTVMLNPEIIKKEQPYQTKESCLSLLGEARACTRYKKIKVRWQTQQLQTRMKTFEGFTAQIIQHEIDHCNGILI